MKRAIAALLLNSSIDRQVILRGHKWLHGNFVEVVWDHTALLSLHMFVVLRQIGLL